MTGFDSYYLSKLKYMLSGWSKIDIIGSNSMVEYILGFLKDEIKAAVAPIECPQTINFDSLIRS